MIEGTIRADRGAREAVQGILRNLMESGVVDALLVGMQQPGGMVGPMLVRDVEALAEADPLAPVMGINSARAVANLTAMGHRQKLGVVLRSCEIRALVELVKFQQAKLDNVLVIGVDCLGAYPVVDYQQAGERQALMAGLLAGAEGGELAPQEGLSFREACQICEQPVPEGEHVGLTIGLLGCTPGQVYVKAQPGVAEGLGLEGNGQPPGREQAVARLVEARTKARDEAFSEIRERMQGVEGLLGEFGACIRCHNCMTNCPICYCKECIFRTATFEHESEVYYQWAERKGSVRMMPDTLLFHLTRLNHMATSCVGCGVCTEVCPVEIPVGLIFRAVGEKVQGLFEYQPGRSLEEAAPVQEFREDELTMLGTRPG